MNKHQEHILARWRPVIDFTSDVIPPVPDNLRYPLANLFEEVEKVVGSSNQEYLRVVIPCIRYQMGIDDFKIARVWSKFGTLKGDKCYILKIRNENFFYGIPDCFQTIALPLNVEKSNKIRHIHSFTTGYDGNVNGAIKIEDCEIVEYENT
jgi:hypothetical protein